MDPDLSILLLGKTGAGKSASANTILGREAFESKAFFTSVTAVISEVTGEVFGNRIRVIDTPGISDGKDTEDTIKTCCQELIESSRPHLFLVVVKIGRFTAEEQKAVEAAIRVLGSEGLRKSNLLFTGGDLLKTKSLYDFIFEQDDDSLPDLVDKTFGGAYHLFNNENKDQEQVRKLLQKTGFLRTGLQFPDMDPDLSILLLGKSGAGKSASANTLLGREAFVSKFAFKPVTTVISEETGVVFEKRIRVIDTPGILENDAEDTIKTCCQELLQSSRPHLFLVVVSTGRFSAEEQKAVEASIRVLGSQGLENCYLLFTGGDLLKTKSLYDFIFEQDDGSFLDVVKKFGGAYHLFNNENKEQEQVRKLLQRTGFLRTREQLPRPPGLQFPDMDPDLSILLLGKSGAGKSASANTILGREAFVSKFAFKPVTTVISEETGVVFEKRIRVIDTPGILENDAEDTIKTCCQELLQSSRPHMFLVVVKIGRFNPEEQIAVEASIRVLGRQGMKRSHLLFTGGDNLRNMSLIDFIFSQEDGSLPDVVKKFAGSYHLFNNENKDQVQQVRKLLQKTGFLRTREQLPRPPDRRIVLVGLPGAGKSSSGNTILGSHEFESGCNFNAVSTECLSASATVEGCQVTVVDTPGFNDSALTPEQLYLEIMKTLVLASPGPHAIVIVVRIGRVSEAEQKLFEILPTLFGSDASNYAMVLFTGGDMLRGQSIDQMILPHRYVSELVSMCGGRYSVFDNTQRGNRQQVREFLNKIDEMVAASGEHCDSDMFRMAETFIREEIYLSDSESKPKSKDCNLL